MGRSQDYMSHYYDDMFEPEPEPKPEPKPEPEPEVKPIEERTKNIEQLTTNIPERMLPILGCIAGDFVGSRFERDYKELEHFGSYELITPECKFTDDTVFTIAVMQTFTNGHLKAKNFTDNLVKWGRKYPEAGYGRATQAWIASENPQPYGSNRNGAAMRVAPCASFARSLDKALEYARISAEVSHNTPEGVTGAQAVVAAIFMAMTGATKEDIRDYVQGRFGYDLDMTMQRLRNSWSGFSCKAADTVPQALVCFLESHNVESAIRNAISLCSDADTISAMAAAIAAPYYHSIPFIGDVLKELPTDMLNELVRCSCILKFCS